MTQNGKDSYYFSHDANARSDPKIMALVAVYGMAGYGMFWSLVEMLREQTGYKLEQTESNWLAIAQHLLSKPDEAQKFVADLCERFRLFDTDGAFFWSPSLLRRMEHMDNVREKRKEAGAKGGRKPIAKQKLSKSKPIAKQSILLSFPLSSFPEYVHLQKIDGFDRAWSDFVAHRRESKKPLTERAASLALGQLATFTDPVQSLRDSVMNGWTGVFPTKGKPDTPKPKPQLPELVVPPHHD